MTRTNQWGRACVLGAILMSVSRASAQMPVSQCGQVLSKPGDYVLTTDVCNPLGGNPPVGIVISSSRVHLNTAGHTVGTISTALVINDGLSRIRINGGGSLAGGTGVVIGSDRDVTLDNLTLGASSSYASGVAVQLNNANRVEVTNSTIESGGCNGGGPAISGTVDKGLFSHNTISTAPCGHEGDIGLGGAGNIIRDNTINVQNDFGPFTYGISVTSDTVIEGNTITLIPGSARILNKIGINLTGDSNRVEGNTIEGSGYSYGIFAAEGAIGNSITKNSVSGDQFDLFDSNGPPCVNTWKHNQFQTSGGAVACIN